MNIRKQVEVQTCVFTQGEQARIVSLLWNFNAVNFSKKYDISAAYQQPPPFVDSKEPFWGHDYYGLWLLLFIIAIIILFFLLLKLFSRKEQSQVKHDVSDRNDSVQKETEQEKGWTLWHPKLSARNEDWWKNSPVCSICQAFRRHQLQK